MYTFFSNNNILLVSWFHVAHSKNWMFLDNLNNCLPLLLRFCFKLLLFLVLFFAKRMLRKCRSFPFLESLPKNWPHRIRIVYECVTHSKLQIGRKYARRKKCPKWKVFENHLLEVHITANKCCIMKLGYNELFYNVQSSITNKSFDSRCYVNQSG